MSSPLRIIPRILNQRWWVVAAYLVVILAVIGLAIYAVIALTTYSSSSNAASQQPIAFSHKTMVSLGIDCQFCHADARRSEAAGMPSVEKCMGCHKVVDPTNPIIEQVAAYWEKGQPIPWVRVNQLPRFVYFSHEVHVTVAKLDCATCHGDVADEDIAQPIPNLNMGWCLHCHEQQANAKQLTDCVICHQ